MQAFRNFESCSLLPCYPSWSQFSSNSFCFILCCVKVALRGELGAPRWTFTRGIRGPTLELSLGWKGGCAPKSPHLACPRVPPLLRE